MTTQVIWLVMAFSWVQTLFSNWTICTTLHDRDDFSQTMLLLVWRWLNKARMAMTQTTQIIKLFPSFVHMSQVNCSKGRQIHACHAIACLTAYIMQSNYQSQGSNLLWIWPVLVKVIKFIATEDRLHVAPISIRSHLEITFPTWQTVGALQEADKAKSK